MADLSLSTGELEFFEGISFPYWSMLVCSWLLSFFWLLLSGWTDGILETYSTCSGLAWLVSSPNVTATLPTGKRWTCSRRWCLDRDATPGRLLLRLRRFRSPRPAPCWSGAWWFVRIWIWVPSGTCGRGWPSQSPPDRWVTQGQCFILPCAEGCLAVRILISSSLVNFYCF